MIDNNDPSAENAVLHADSGQPWLASLDHQKLLTITGPDAEKFLQGQTTCDIRRLARGKILLGAHCDHKGRMHSSFIAAKLADDCIALRLHASTAESATAMLQKYIVFSKAKLALTEDYQLLALFGTGASAALAAIAPEVTAEDGHYQTGESLTLLRHDAEYFELWVHRSRVASLRQQLQAVAAPAGTELWDLLQIVRGQGQVQAETVGEFIPQMLNFQAIGGISFDKGCYTGQEVVARMHYLGKLKKHMYRASAAVDQAPTPGTAIYATDGDTVVGTVVQAASMGSGQSQLLFVSTEVAAQESTLALAAAGGPRLQLLPIPYAVD